MPLVGAEGYRALWNQRRALAVSADVHVARIEHLLNRYGSCIHELLDMLRDGAVAGRPAARRGRLPRRSRPGTR